MNHLTELILIIAMCTSALCFFDATAVTAQVTRKKSAPIQAPTSAPVTYDRGEKVVGTAGSDLQELRCRGGSALFRIDNIGPKDGAPDTVVLALNFEASAEAAGAESGGLKAGTCSWINATVNESDPRQIQFNTSAGAQVTRIRHGNKDTSPTAAERYPDAQTIPAYLNDSKHYWSFFVRKTNQGYFEAARHEPWKKLNFPYETGVNSNTKATSYTLSDVRVEPGLKFVNFTFVSLTGAEPVVELGQDWPIPRTDGSWIYPSATVRLPAVPTRADSDKPISRYALSVQSLNPNTAYHYVITVPPKGDSPGQQKTGTVTTLGRTVTVVFTQIHILNDSDQDSDGDLVFYFSVNEIKGGPTRRWGDFLREKISLPDGAKRNLRDVVSPIVIKNAPDTIVIEVRGYDHDGDVLIEFTPPHGFLRPNSNAGWEWNKVNFSFDLAKYPRTSGTEYFTRRSMSIYNNEDVTLMFEVSGRIEISTP